jgi:16S rRNA (guanine966-N2)-methyltransferase
LPSLASEKGLSAQANHFYYLFFFVGKIVNSANICLCQHFNCMQIFSGRYKNRIIKSPKGLKTRPTSGRLREALFNICQGYNEEALFLDLFAGSGAMGLEALSRGARFATFVDNSIESVRCIQANIQNLGVEKQSEVFYGDVFECLQKLAKKGRHFDIIYADPPYYESKEAEGKLSYSIRVLRAIDQLIDQGSSLLSPEASLFLEDASGSIPEDESFKYLVLKSARKMGRSALQHYVYKKG